MGRMDDSEVGEKRQHTKWAQAFEVIQRDRRLLWLRATSSEGLTGLTRRCSMYKYFPSDPCHLLFVPPGSRWGCVTPCSSLVASEGAMRTPQQEDIGSKGGARVWRLCTWAQADFWCEGRGHSGLAWTCSVVRGLSFLICETDVATLASSGMG